MKTTPIALFLASTIAFTASIARGDSTPLFTILGKDVMRDEISFQSESSEASHQSIDESIPDGRPDNWEECYRIHELMRNIAPVIQNKFIDDNKLRPSEDEIVEYMGRLKYVYEFADGRIVTNNIKDDIDPQMLRHEALQSLTEWKLNVALYETYGGRLATYNETLRPVDAVYVLLKDAEGDGIFTIHDNDLRTLFWSCITNLPAKYLSDEDGKSALYRHPADYLVASASQMLSDVMSKAKASIDSKESNNEVIGESSEHKPPEGRGAAPRP